MVTTISRTWVILTVTVLLLTSPTAIFPGDITGGSSESTAVLGADTDGQSGTVHPASRYGLRDTADERDVRDDPHAGVVSTGSDRIRNRELNDTWDVQRLSNNSVDETFIKVKRTDTDDGIQTISTHQELRVGIEDDATVAWYHTTPEGNFAANYTRLDSSGTLEKVDLVELTGLDAAEFLSASFSDGYVALATEGADERQKIYIVDTATGDYRTTTWPPGNDALSSDGEIDPESPETRTWAHSGAELGGVVNHDGVDGVSPLGSGATGTNEILRYSNGDWRQETRADHFTVECPSSNGDFSFIYTADPSIPHRLWMDTGGSDDFAWVQERHNINQSCDGGSINEDQGRDLARGDGSKFDETVVKGANESDLNVNVFDEEILIFNRSYAYRHSETKYLRGLTSSPHGGQVQDRSFDGRETSARTDGWNVVWLGQPANESDTEVYSYTDEIQRLTDNDVDEIAVRVDGNYIAWARETHTFNEKLEVYSDLTDEVVGSFWLNVSQPGFRNPNRQVWDLHGDTLAWVTRERESRFFEDENLTLKRYRIDRETLVEGKTKWRSVENLQLSASHVFARAKREPDTDTEVYAARVPCERDVAIGNQPRLQAVQGPWPQSEGGNHLVRTGPFTTDPGQQAYPPADAVVPDANGRLHGEQSFPLVPGKNTSLFGAAPGDAPPSEYPEARSNITLRITNQYREPKDVRIKLDRGVGLGWVTKRSFRVDACSLETGRGETTVNLTAPVPNTTRWQRESADKPFALTFTRHDDEVNLEVVEDGSVTTEFDDNDPGNQRYTLDVNVSESAFDDSMRLQYWVALNATEMADAVTGWSNWRRFLAEEGLAAQREYVRDAFPIGEDAISYEVGGWVPLLERDSDGDPKASLGHVIERTTLKSTREGDRAPMLVVVDPQLAEKAGAAGLAWYAPVHNRTVFLDEDESDNSTLGHELGHNLAWFGHDHNRSIAGNASTFDQGDREAIEAHGYRVNAGQRIRNASSMMSWELDRWIKRPAYLDLFETFRNEAFLDRFRKSSGSGETTTRQTTQRTLQVTGTLSQDGTFSAAPFYEHRARPSVTEESTGNYRLVVEDENGTRRTYGFEPNFASQHADPGGRIEGPVPLSFEVPAGNGVERVALRKAGETVFERTRTSNPPSVEVVSPSANETLGPNSTIRWRTTDPDGDEVAVSVFLRFDGGEQWHLWRADTQRRELHLPEVNAERMSVSLIASDGINTVERTATFPTAAVQLNLTANVSTVTRGQPVEFTVTREDTGAPVNATVRVNGTARITGPDGRVTRSFEQRGTVTVTASKPPTGMDTFIADETTVTVRPPRGTGNESLTAAVDHTPSIPEIGENVTFDASGSVDPDGLIASYTWDFDGDGQIDSVTTTPTTTHSYANAGTYEAALTVTDADGATDTDTVTVTVESDGTDDGGLSATRDIDSTTVPAGESTEVTVSIEASATTSNLRFTETFDSALSASVVSDDGATNSSAASDEVAASWGGVSDATITYEVTIPEDASDGTTYDLSGTVEDRDAGTEVSIDGDTTIEVGEPNPVAQYANDQGIVDSVGLLDAAADFREGEIGSRVLLDVAAAFRSGNPVA